MSLAPGECTLVRLSAAIALGRWDLLRTLRRSALPGEPDRRWREVVLQTHLFAGFPRVVEACSVLAEEGGLGQLEPDERANEPDLSGAGSALFEAIYADQAALVRSQLAGFHPALLRWIEGHAYGRVLARAGLAARTRELCAVAALAAQGQDRQLASHARGALRLGASPQDVRASLEAIADLLDAAARERAHEVIAHFARPENL